MATTVEIEVIAKTGQADKSIKDTTSSVEHLKDETKQLEKQNVKTAKSSKGIGVALKGIGVAFKAIGIGLIIALFAKLGDALSKNQKVVDFFSTAMESLAIVFSDFFDFVIDNFLPAMYSVRDFFANLTFDAIGKSIKENLTERFMSLLEVTGFVGEAFKKLFEGDFAGALESVKEAGKEMVDVMTGVDDTVGKVAETVTNVANAVSDYAAATIKTAAANVQLANSAELAAAQQGRLVEQYDRLAEQQRQIRDEERNSIEDRIAANDRLGKVLEDQEKAMISQANLQVAAAQAQVNTNDNIANQVELTNALANKEAILAQVEGFRSEQLVNDLALKKELIELDNSITDSEKARQIAQLEFEASRETDPLKKLEAERLALEEEKLIEQERLEAKILQFKEGTQARVDAEIELKDRLQEINNEITENADATALEQIAIDEKVAEAKQTIQEQSFKVAENGIGLLKTLFEKNKGLQKALLIAESVAGIAKIIVNTQAANSAATLKYALIPGGAALAATEQALNKVSAGIGIAANIAATAKAISALGGGGGASAGAGAGGGGSAGASAPSFNVVGNSGVSQIAQTLNQEQEPIQAYVVASNVSTAQEVNRNIVDNATIG